MKTLWRCIYAESIKAKNSFEFWLTMSGSVGIVISFILLHNFQVAGWVLSGAASPWNQFFLNCYRGLAFMLLPLFIVILTNLVAFSEHRNTQWKQLFVQPISKGGIYFGKFIFTYALFVVAHLLFVVQLLLGGVILGIVMPSSGLFSIAPDFILIFQLIIKTLLSVLGLFTLHFWLSMRFRHFIVPLGIGIVLYVFSLAAVERPEMVFNPYVHSELYLAVYQDFSVLKLGATVGSIEWISLSWCLIFATLGYLDFRRLPLQ